MKQIKPAEDKKTTDWEAINRRLEAARTSIEEWSGHSGPDISAILKERARLLGIEKKQAPLHEEETEVVEFMLSDERYGVPTGHVLEVYPFDDYTPVPCTPNFVLGIINVRGHILSVIDIRQFFDLPSKGLSDMNKVIILHSGELGFGILADSVIGVRAIAAADMQATLPTLTGIREEYLKGVTHDGVAVLDAEKLLLDRGLIVHEDV